MKRKPLSRSLALWQQCFILFLRAHLLRCCHSLVVLFGDGGLVAQSSMEVGKASLMNKIQRTWSLMSACWQILKKDKEMLVFPLISGLCCLLVMASFALPLYFTGAWHPPKSDAATGQQVMYYGMLFLFYACNYFVVIFFNCAIVACATIRMTGGDLSVGDGF